MEKIFSLPNKCIQSKWLQMFQYKILHRILPTNKKLFQYNIKQSSDCEYCGQAEESLIHLFCECDIASVIWQEVVDWLGKQLIKTEYLTDSPILLGEPSFDPVVNRVLITTKMIIFKNKMEMRAPRLPQVIASLKLQFKTEKSIASNNNKEVSFNGFWSPLWDKVSGE